MKNLTTALIAMLFLYSCSNDNSTDPITPSSVSNAVKSGDWEITYYFDDQDETHHFNGYVFTFQDDGTLDATNGSTSYSGTWSSDLDDDSSHPELNIYFNTTGDFEELNDDWDVLSQTANKIELTDTSGGNGGIDNLIFEKI